MTDYFSAATDDGTKAGPALTPNSTPSDVTGLVEILRLITDPVAHKKKLAELQRMLAEVDRRIAAATRREIELKKQVDALAQRRAEFDRQLEIDRENHIGRRLVQEQVMADKLKAAEQFFDKLNIRSDPQPEVTDAA